MTDEQVQADILRYLYHSWTGDEPDTRANLNTFAQERDLSDQLVWSEFALLREKGLVRAVTAGGWVELTTQGVLHVEELGIAPNHHVRENQLIRARILEVLAKIREDGGSYALVDWTQVALRANLEQYTFLRNAKILEDVGLIRWRGNRSPQITAEGLEKATEWHRWVRLSEEYRCLGKADPHKRGHLFEKLLAQVISMDAWACEINVRRPGEEHDIVLHREREYYLIECKWHNEPIGAKTVREFRDRVLARVGVRGILISMSDFTTPAIRDVESRLSDCMILLFGRKDIDALFEGITTFTGLLGEKFNAAVSQRKVVL
jgi:Mn-dependent DtxR family transcriptional regulator